jgi:3-oxoacyl-[acyl-carrier protein] reductase
VHDACGGFGTQVAPVGCDVATEAGVQACFDLAFTRFQGVDLLHNNAAVLGPQQPLADTPLEVFEHLMGVNVRSVFLASRAFLRHRQARSPAVPPSTPRRSPSSPAPAPAQACTAAPSTRSSG